MEYNDEIMLRYGSTSQRKKTRSKLAYDKSMQEVEWRKEAIEGWEALIKHAQFGTSMVSPNDSMIIGVLGENCFNSFTEYKQLQQEHPDKGFIQLASAMLDMNRQIKEEMTKVARSYYGNTKMVKTAKSEKMYLKSDDVVNVFNKIANLLDDDMKDKVSNVINNVKNKDMVSVGSVKGFICKYAQIEKAFKKIVK